jgi:hypothetical protein
LCLRYVERGFWLGKPGEHRGVRPPRGATYVTLAYVVLAAHLAVILFNILGFVVVPLGAAFGWQVVRIRWWRILHIVLLAAIAAQALLGRACVLTLWQAALTGDAADRAPLIARWIDRLIYWRLPMWVFASFYLFVFGWALAMFRLVPPQRSAASGLLFRSPKPHCKIR